MPKQRAQGKLRKLRHRLNKKQRAKRIVKRDERIGIFSY